MAVSNLSFQTSGSNCIAIEWAHDGNARALIHKPQTNELYLSIPGGEILYRRNGVMCKLSTSVGSPVPPFPCVILGTIHTEVVCLSHTTYRIPPWTWTGYLYLRVELDVEDEFQCTYSALVTDGHFITFCVIYYLHVDCSHMHHSEWNCSTISSGPPICWGWYQSCQFPWWKCSRWAPRPFFHLPTREFWTIIRGDMKLHKKHGTEALHDSTFPVL